MSANLLAASHDAAIHGYMAYGPPGAQQFFVDNLPREIGLIESWLPNFGDCLFKAIGGLFAAGHTSAVVLNSDSPTLPTALLVETAEALAQPGDRAVLGPSTDGGYYLLGIKQAHRRLFDDIDWSTERVARQTLERAQEIGLDVHCLPAWYDVDDSQALRQLHAELFDGGSLDPALIPFHAPDTAALMENLLVTADLRSPARTVAQGIRKARFMTAVAGQTVDPRRYFESVDARRSQKAERLPVCVYLETTNRCNLLCTTCPRTYAELEPPADMSWALFTSIVDQIPHLERAVLHGVGEPMLVKNLPKMVRYLKDRGTYVLFNTNGTVLNDKNGRALIDAGLDELRVSLDAANAKSFLAIRGADFFNRILRNVRRFRELQVREGHERPRVSAWLTGLKETIAELPAFVRVAADIGVKEVYLQRLVYFESGSIGKARPDQALFERMTAEEAVYLDEAAALARSLGMTFSASGAASEPGMSLTRANDGSPWSLCRRPWSVMYFTANGRALPCCIAPFSQRGYENYTLGDATQQTLREIWDGPGLFLVP